MPDIRINALTEASASVTTDFLPIDGSTGTRKLSAFSPTFGGNATVGGTLTVSGASVNSSGTNSVVKSTDGAVVTKVQSVLGSTLGIVGTESNHDLGVYTNNTTRLNISAAGVVSISGTTASTTTSSGALVVGNGTSGGLGVGGAITLGGRLNAFGTTAALTHQVYVYNQSASATNAALSGTQHIAQPGYSTFVGTTGNGTNASYQGSVLGSVVVSEQGYVISDAVRGLLLHGINGGIKFATNNPGTQAGSISNAGVWTVDTTTASNSTTSGALVVSGGVGVAKELYVGSATESNSNTTGGLVVSGGLGLALNLNMGGRLFVNNTGAANDALSASAIIANFGADATLGSLAFGIKGYPSATAANRYVQISAGDNANFREVRINDQGGNVKIGGTNSVLTVSGTTASTTTSSGALVVSGGVGVAGAIYAGTTGANHSHVFTGGDLGSGSTIFAARDYNGANQFVVGGSGIVQISNSLQLNGASNVFRIVNSQTPASASATGSVGTITWDSSYIYVCTATNTWKRVAIATW